MNQKAIAIIPAGGTGTRMGLPYPKQLMPFRGQTLIEATLALFEGIPTYVPVPLDHRDVFESLIGTRAQVVTGGATRHESVRNAFESANPHPNTWVIIHDAARPYWDPSTLERALAAATSHGALIYATPATDTVKWVDRDTVEKTLNRDRVWLAQTPQIFKASLLRACYDATPDPMATDEATMVEMQGHTVMVFPSSIANKKITQPEDVLHLQSSLRMGHGYDVHRFDAGRPLFLGGIEIPGGPGLLGHSDADVAIHALIDAMLGAAGRGDIGQWFPDNDPSLKGIRSTELLARVWADLSVSFDLVNADITIQAQVPKLAPHTSAMRQKLAEIMRIDISCINIKATTTEGLGFIGECQGMAADAVALLSQRRSI